MNIYKITNLINNKIYIGQTKNNIKLRFSKHCSERSGCPKLSRAIKKYGKHNFIIELIEICKNKEELNNREKFWINYYKSNTINGYNITAGGTNFYLSDEDKNKRRNYLNLVRKKTPVIARDLNTQEETYFSSIKEVKDRWGFKETRIFCALKRKDRKYKNFLWRKTHESFIQPEKYYPYQAIPIIGINFITKEILIYTQIKNSKIDGFDRNHISNACKTNKSYKNFHWAYLTVELSESLSQILLGRKLNSYLLKDGNK